MDNLLSSFTVPNLIGGFIFSSIGLIAFVHGKKEQEVKPFTVGLILMVYPFFVANTFLLYGIGTLLTAFLFFNN